MSLWKIAGQSGKSLPAAQVDLEVAGCLNARLTFRSQAADSLTFFLHAPDAASNPTYLPEYEQNISIFRAGVRQFSGIVSSPEFVWQGAQVGWNITATGGWTELERIPLVNGNASYERAQSNLTATIQDIVSKAIAAGAQIALGSVASSFTMIPLTFRALSCGAALAECLRLLPDAVAFFDYTGGGLPILNITRRASMATRTYTFGTAEIERCTITPQSGQTPDRVEITYATHDVNGIVSETTQAAGAGTSRKQVMVLAQDGFADFTTRATAAQIALQTSTSAGWAYAQATDPKLKDIPGIPTPTTGNATYVTGNTSGSKSTVTIGGRSPAFAGLASPHLYPLIAGEIKDYMREKLGITTGTATFTADFWWKWRKTINGAVQDKPDWLVAVLAAGGFVEESGWWNATNTVGTYYGPHPDYDSILLVRYPAQFTATTINRSIPALTNFRDPGEYSSSPPPSDLATNLLSVQNFIPWRGRVSFTPWEPYTRDLGKKCNFPGASPLLNSIGAIPQEESISLVDERRELLMGLPSRQALTGLMSRFRKTSAK